MIFPAALAAAETQASLRLSELNTSKITNPKFYIPSLILRLHFKIP